MISDSDFIWPFLPPYMYKGVIPYPKIGLYFPNFVFFGDFFPNSLRKIPICKGKGSFPKSQIKSLSDDYYKDSFISYS